jgi:molybdate transport system ATP-binding protein
VTGALTVSLHQAGPIPLAVELTCAPGDLVALVGPSGAGKTTILRSIAGLYRPQSGRIAVDGETWLASDNRVAVPPYQRRVGMVFQNYALFPHLTALRNVMTALDHMPKPARRRRAEELLDLLHLPGLGDRKPAQLSSGQQQRVAVARALARDPAVLLLDEPFSAVDRVTRRKLYKEITEVRRYLEIPIILVTHDIDEAMLLADRMYVLNEGRILQSGTPAQVTKQPASDEVIRVLGLDL